MTTIEEMDALAEQMYTSSDNATRQRASAALEPHTLEGADLAPFHAVLQHSCSPYSLVFAAQGLVRWFKVNGKYLDQDQKRDLIVNRCGQCLQRIAVTDAPRHVVLSLISMYAKLTKLAFEREPFLKEAVEDVVGLLTSAYAQCRSSLTTVEGGGGAGIGATPPPSSGADPSGAVSGDAGSVQENRRLYFLALLLLDGLVTEFSKYDSSKSLTYMNFAYHRRCSNNFRDECMLTIFQAALTQLEYLTHKGFVVEVVDLVRSCLTFDFMAIMVDETEEALSAQFPSTWRDVVLAPHTQDVLWGQHRALPYPHCEVLLTGLTSVCGIRRTFFESQEERIAYLDVTLERIGDALTNPVDDRLTNPHYVNTLAEACTRLIPPFGYRDLHQSRGFLPWVRAVYTLSQQVFATPFGQPGSFTTATTLMGFWSRLCTSRRMYAGLDEPPSDLETMSPALTLDIFQSRVNVGGAPGREASSRAGNGGSGTPPRTGDDLAVVEELMDDMDGAMEAVLSQADSLGSIAVVSQKTSMGALAAYAQQQLGPAVLSSPLATGWLFFFAGSLVKHILNNLEDSALDECGNFLMFCVDCVNHRRLSGAAEVTISRDPQTNAALGNFCERGLLFMLKNMQTVFSSMRQHSSLSLLVTNIFQDRAQLFQFILNSTGGNLMRSPTGLADEETAEIMRTSMELIGEAVREVPQDILRELSFDLPPVVQLPLSQSMSTYKLRTELYRTLWPLSMASRYREASSGRGASGRGGHTGGGAGGPGSGSGGSAHYTREALQRFLRPIHACIQTTMTSDEGTSPMYVAGWLRDLRGVVMALQDDVANGPQAIADFLEWFCDEYNVFASIIASPVGESPLVTTSLLRLMIELVNTRGGRMHFTGLGNHSILGLTLFKNLCEFMRQIVERCVTEEKIRIASESGAAADTAYDTMMKPLCLAMTCLRKCVGDGFVPLGAMWFYNDETYDNTLLGLLRMLGVFPFSLFRSYAETTFAVVDLLRAICEDDSYQPLARLSPQDLQAVINFVVEVCEDTDTQTGTLIHGLTFLGFIAGFARGVKALSLSPTLHARAAGVSPPLAGASLSGHHTPPPLSPMQLPQYYAVPGTGRISGTPGGGGDRGGAGGGRPPSRLAREARVAIARLLEPTPDLWLRLISVGMNVIVLQDRAMSASCALVYPVMEVHPPFWHRFVDEFVPTYPEHKRGSVREALSTLFNNAESSERFFSEVFTLRQTLRNL